MVLDARHRLQAEDLLLLRGVLLLAEDSLGLQLVELLELGHVGGLRRGCRSRGSRCGRGGCRRGGLLRRSGGGLAAGRAPRGAAGDSAGCEWHVGSPLCVVSLTAGASQALVALGTASASSAVMSPMATRSSG